ncbi:GNAT family N-acetyltransferase [Cedecea neteri]|uniref:GNAT family N-acetyltransferase n=1 Tax=Cedecea neteri TaxID=158822 RepID=UPI00289A912C|nr:GNAT family N-acetyltransferase [Cedecea neteri]
MSNVNVVEWRDEYRDDFISLSIEWLEKYVSVEPVDLEILHNPESYILSPGGAIFFAQIDNENVGTVSMIPKPDGDFELAKLAVTEKCKGKRIGNLLMEKGIAYARERGAKKVILFTTGTLVAAVSLYRKYGFVEVKLEDNKYLEADIRMELQLN